MTAITLDSIKNEQIRLAEMIAAFETQSAPSKVRLITLPEIEIQLKDGEHYAGVVLNKEGEISYHLILLPSEAESINWSDAKSWAASNNGELPTRREQSLLCANLKEQFSLSWYWSSEQHASNTALIWCQHFNYGDQDTFDKPAKLRARAIRRELIK